MKKYKKNKILANARIFLTDIPEEWRIRRLVESSFEALKRAEDMSKDYLINLRETYLNA